MPATLQQIVSATLQCPLFFTTICSFLSPVILSTAFCLCRCMKHPVSNPWRHHVSDSRRHPVSATLQHNVSSTLQRPVPAALLHPVSASVQHSVSMPFSILSATLGGFLSLLRCSIMYQCPVSSTLQHLVSVARQHYVSTTA